MKRLNIALALLAIDEVATLRSQNESQNETEDEQSLEAKNYISSKQMATCYRKLVTVLCSDSLALSDKADDIVITLLVEFKNLVTFNLQVFLIRACCRTICEWIILLLRY